MFKSNEPPLSFSSSSSSSSSSSPVVLQQRGVGITETTTFLKGIYKKAYKNIDNTLYVDSESKVLYSSDDGFSVFMKNGAVVSNPSFYNVHPPSWYSDLEIPYMYDLISLIKLYFKHIAVFYHFGDRFEASSEYMVNILTCYPMSRITSNAYKLDNFVYQNILAVIAEWRLAARRENDKSLLDFTTVISDAAFRFFEMLSFMRYVLFGVSTAKDDELSVFDGYLSLDEIFIGKIDSFALLFSDPDHQMKEISIFIDDLVAIGEINGISGKDVLDNNVLFCISPFDVCFSLIPKRRCLLKDGNAIFPLAIFQNVKTLSNNRILGVLASITKRHCMMVFDSLKKKEGRKMDESLFDWWKALQIFFTENKIYMAATKSAITHTNAVGLMMKYSLAPVNEDELDFGDIPLEYIRKNGHYFKFPPCVNGVLNKLRMKGDLKFTEKLFLVSFLTVIGMKLDDIYGLFTCFYKTEDKSDKRKKKIANMYKTIHENVPGVKKLEFYNCGYAAVHHICIFTREISETYGPDDLSAFYGIPKFEATHAFELNNIVRQTQNRSVAVACAACSASCSKYVEKDESRVLSASCVNPISFYVMRNRKRVEISYASSSSSSNTYEVMEVDTSVSMGEQYCDDDSNTMGSVSRYSQKSSGPGLRYLQDEKVKRKSFLPLVSLSRKKNTNGGPCKSALFDF